jgi:hypothetical protein
MATKQSWVACWFSKRGADGEVAPKKSGTRLPPAQPPEQAELKCPECASKNVVSIPDGVVSPDLLLLLDER